MLATLLCTAGIVSHLADCTATSLRNAEAHINEYAPGKDVDLLARCITAEMGYNKDDYVYYLSGSVVLNRMRSDDFPTNLYDVIYQPGQYECVTNHHIDRKPDPAAIDVANRLLLDGTALDPDVVFQAEFKQGHGVYTYINNSYFCYK